MEKWHCEKCPVRVHDWTAERAIIDSNGCSYFCCHIQSQLIHYIRECRRFRKTFWLFMIINGQMSNITMSFLSLSSVFKVKIISFWSQVCQFTNHFLKNWRTSVFFWGLLVIFSLGFKAIKYNSGLAISPIIDKFSLMYFYLFKIYLMRRK